MRESSKFNSIRLYQRIEISFCYTIARDTVSISTA